MYNVEGALGNDLFKMANVELTFFALAVLLLGFCSLEMQTYVHNNL